MTDRLREGLHDLCVEIDALDAQGIETLMAALDEITELERLHALGVDSSACPNANHDGVLEGDRRSNGTARACS